MALNRDAAIEANAFNIRAIYYRNADIEFSLKLRQAQGRLWQMELPLKQERHHGYYDTDEAAMNRARRTMTEYSIASAERMRFWLHAVSLNP